MQLEKKVIEKCPVPTLVLDKYGRVIVWNQACEGLTGVSASEVLGTQDAWRGFYAEKKKILAELVLEEAGQALPEKHSGLRISKWTPDELEAEGWFSDLNGKSRYLLITAVSLRSEKGEVLASIETLKDITERKIYEQQLVAGMSQDPVTGLPNRNLLIDRLQQALYRAKRDEDHLAVFCICLDKFVAAVPALDNECSAQILKTISRRLHFEVRAIDTVSYCGNGEFVIIASKFKHEEYMAGLAHRIHAAVSAPISKLGKSQTLTCTVGISAFPYDGDDDSVLLGHANAAMARAERTKKGSLRFYNPELNAKYMTRLNLQAQLKNVLHNNELSLHYQSKASLKTGRMTGMEVLLRWMNNQEGPVSPAVFIPLAERLGLIGEIGNWVFKNACEQHIAWKKQGLYPPPMAINLSGHQLRDEKFICFVEQVLERTGISSDCLELEVTESAVVDNLAAAKAMLTKLKDLGMSISLDDFGTGYSSLSYLKQLPIDKIKIDRSFITEIISDPSSSAITKATIAMAHALQLKVTAEGVENKEQLTYLQRLGCDELQGYYYARPVPADEQEMLLRDRPVLPLRSIEEGKVRRVLIVDDEPAILSSLQRELVLNDFEVEVALSPEEGFSILAQKQIPIVISDFHMPGISGPEFLERVKQLHPETVRIAISGARDLNLLVNAINKGAIFKFIFKPWSGEQLINILDEAFRYYYSKTISTTSI